MDTFKRLICVFLLSFLSVASWGYGRVFEVSQITVTCSGAGGSGTGASYRAACFPILDRAKAAYSDPFYGSDKSWLPNNPSCSSEDESQGNCSGVFKCGGAGTCQVSASGIKKEGSICPEGSSPIAGKPGSCECLKGLKPKGNTCGVYQCPAKGAYSVVTQPDIQVENVGPQCYAGCTVNPSSFKGSPDGKIYATWPYVSTGDSCGGKTASDTGATTGESKVSDAPVKCGAGQCPGTVNGTPVCVPCASTSIPGQSSSASGAASGGSSGNLPDGATSTTNTVCSQSSCTTTTTVTDKNGTVIGEAKQEKPKENFCQENPGLQICKEGRWGGSCGAYSCDGDAIQCALSLQVHKSACEWSTVDPEMKARGEAALAGGDRPPEHPFSAGSVGQSSMAFSSVIDQTNRLGGGCPSDQAISYAGHSYVIPWGKHCDKLQLVGNLMVGVTMLAAAMIVFRG